MRCWTAPAENSASMHRHLLLVGLKLCVSIALLYWLWWRFDFRNAFDHALSFEPGPVFTAFMVLLSHGVLSAWRWRTILTLQGQNFGWSEALRLFFIAMFFNQTLSTTIGGDVARVWMVRRRNVSLGTATSGILLERVAGLLALTPLTLIGLILLPSTDSPALLALLVTTAILVVVILQSGKLREPQNRWLASLGNFAQTARRLLLSVAGLKIFSQSLLIHLGAGMAVYLLSLAANASPGLLVCLTLVPSILLLATLPITLGGWGLREATLVWLFAVFGVAGESALAISVTLGVLVMAAGLPGGVLWVTRGRKARELSKPPEKTT